MDWVRYGTKWDAASRTGRSSGDGARGGVSDVNEWGGEYPRDSTYVVYLLRIINTLYLRERNDNFAETFFPHASSDGKLTS